MTGYDEASDWLKANAPGWRLRQGTQTLKAGYAIGQPTGLLYEVALGLTDDDGWDTSLIGEGGTLLEAVQNAVGALDAADRMGRAIGG